MNKKITILLCICTLFAMSGAVQAYEHKTEPEIRYQAHIQDIGWGPNVLPGCVSGTTGQNLRLEGIKIEVFSPYDYDLNLEYETHIQDIRFYYCSKCGKTSLGGHYDYYNYNY